MDNDKDNIVFQNISKSIAIYKDKNKFIVISIKDKNDWSDTDFNNGNLSSIKGECRKYWNIYTFIAIKKAYKKVIEEIRLKYDDINPHIPDIMRLTAMLN